MEGIQIWDAEAGAAVFNLLEGCTRRMHSFIYPPVGSIFILDQMMISPMRGTHIHRFLTSILPLANQYKLIFAYTQTLMGGSETQMWPNIGYPQTAVHVLSVYLDFELMPTLRYFHSHPC